MCFVSTYPFALARVLTHCKSVNNNKNAVNKFDQRSGRRCIVILGLRVLLSVVTEPDAVDDMGTFYPSRTWKIDFYQCQKC